MQQVCSEENLKYGNFFFFFFLPCTNILIDIEYIVKDLLPYCITVKLQL